MVAAGQARPLAQPRLPLWSASASPRQGAEVDAERQRQRGLAAAEGGADLDHMLLGGRLAAEEHGQLDVVVMPFAHHLETGSSWPATAMCSTGSLTSAAAG